MKTKCRKCKRNVDDEAWAKLEHIARYHRKRFIARLPAVALDQRLDALTKAAIAAMGFVSSL